VAAEGGRKMKRIISAVIALTLFTSLGLAGASCVPIVEAKTGTIEVWVTDAPPGYEITSIMVTVSEEGVEIHKAVAEQEQEQEQEGEGEQNQEQNQEQQQEQQGEGEWITIPITGENPFDLTQLQDGLQQILAIAEVSAGKYTQIRMNVEMVEVTFLKEGEKDETTVEARLPSGKLKFVRPFDVVEGETTVLLLDFDVDKSVVFTGQGKVIVKPVVKLTIQQGKVHQLASVEGTISAVDTEESTISITPNGETEAIVLNVNPQTEITLDGEEAILDDLTELGEGNSVIASYYLNNLKATQIDAQSP
jgi:hypothetical protein